MLGIEDPWEAYQLDLATMQAAMRGRSNQPTSPGRSSALPGKGNGGGTLMSARDAARVMGVPIRKMTIPESGIW